jgi:cell division protein DivIC
MIKLLQIVTNKYCIATVFFIVWMLFFDERDYFANTIQKEKLAALESKKLYYKTEIETAKNQLEELQNNPAALEKFAREKYLMKKQGEDIYMIETDSTSIKK